MYVGIDLEQFARDPYGSGIQRVLQHLAKEWPISEINADFIFPDGDFFVLLTAEQAFEILSLPFSKNGGECGIDLRQNISNAIGQSIGPRVREADLLSMYTAWLLPEVSYLPSVLTRFRMFNASMITVMIGFDALPMTEPANYRFPAGTVSQVSDYFRQLTRADRVICISEHAREEILTVLRRPRNLVTLVAHPGGDHIEPRPPTSGKVTSRFVRLGTLESRKMPVEILTAFLQAQLSDSELVFIGGGSSSDQNINNTITEACRTHPEVSWISGATDSEVSDLIAASDVFLSIGTEGYGLPVLESIALGTPVVYAGTQPAAELMRGKGATRIVMDSPQDLVAAFQRYADPIVIRELTYEIDAMHIPRWNPFTRAVAQMCMS